MGKIYFIYAVCIQSNWLLEDMYYTGTDSLTDREQLLINFYYWEDDIIAYVASIHILGSTDDI